MTKVDYSKLLASVQSRLINFHAGHEHKAVQPRLENSSGTTKLYLYDQIGGYEGIRATDVVNALSGVRGDVDVHINSGGGEIFEGVAIHNALKNYKGRITTYIDGVAASAASFIAMAADEIVIEPNATMMVHDGNGLCIGNAQDMRDAADLLDMLSDTIAEMYAHKAGGKTTVWRATMREKDTWYTASEALQAGLVDRVADHRSTDAENTLDLSVFNVLGEARAPQPAGETVTTTNSGFAVLLKEALL